MSISENMNDLSEFISPVIITYNRAKLLKATLQAFAESALHDVHLHVLDNASTDDTPNVINEMKQLLPNLTYHRNPYNIGGNANILRSVELAATPYHWVIGDDDAWTLSPEGLQELALVLAKGEADIVRLGWLVSHESRGELEEARTLLSREQLFFASLSMISATIYKRSMVINALAESYLNIADSYPQLVAPIRASERGKVTVYTMTDNLMTHTPSQTPGYFAGDLEWYAGWYRTSRFFTNKAQKQSFVREITHYMCRQKPGLLSEQIWLTKVVLYYKSFGLNQWPYLLSMLAYGSGRRLSVLALMLVNALSPMLLLSGLRKCYFKLNKLPQKTIQIDRSRL